MTTTPTPRLWRDRLDALIALGDFAGAALLGLVRLPPPGPEAERGADLLDHPERWRESDQLDALDYAFGRRQQIAQARVGDTPRDVLDRTCFVFSTGWRDDDHLADLGYGGDPCGDDDPDDHGGGSGPLTGGRWIEHRAADGRLVARTYVDLSTPLVIGGPILGPLVIGDEDRCPPLPDDVDAGGTQLDTGKVGMPGPREVCPAPFDHCLARHDHGQLGAGWTA